jgi:Resolvase, N terminal domain
VSGADPIETRPGFSALLDRIEDNGVRTVLVEDASRFARHLIVQEAGIIALIERGVRVLTASGDDLTASEDPIKVTMRQIAGVFAQLEKARLVAKLKAARDRKRATLAVSIEVSRRCETEAGIPLDAMRRPRYADLETGGGVEVPVMQKRHHAPPWHMMKLTKEREMAAYVWVHPDDDDRRSGEDIP